MKYIFSLCFLCTSLFNAFSQSAFAPYNNDYYYLLDRYEIKSNHLAKQFYSAYHPYQRQDIASFVQGIEKDTTIKISKRDQFNLQYLSNDNWEFIDSAAGNRKKPFLKFFYTKQNSFYSYQEKNFEVQVNPILYVYAGKEFVNGASNPDMVMLNTRGGEIRGRIGKRIAFYSMLADNQARFPVYVNNVINATNAVPYQNFYKPFAGNSTKLYSLLFKGQGYDFFTAKGYISFDVIKKIINVQFGQDNNFIGNGYRSLLLSNFSSPYLFGKITTKVWKLNYTLLYAQMAYNTSQAAYTLFPKKFLATHMLSLNLGKHFNIGIFESVMCNRADANYYNPIIFYKTIVNQLGARDKAIIGFDFKTNFARHFSVYGQILINEFVLSNIVSRNGWWGNKQAGQIGVKYIDALGVKNLDLQFEANIVRPYVYSARDSSITAYTNYNTPIAHPLGANFYEFIGVARYQPINRLNLTAKLFYITQGLNTPGKNWGSDPSQTYMTYVNAYGNYIGQGDLNKTVYADFTASFMLRHNFFIELTQVVRNQTSQSGMHTLKDSYTAFGIRWNIERRLNEF
ncbi:MAG: hypothetical protein JST67_08975 [Bacteroidetes bacterium]|nr:hypothetical protein [Bacteroidota bacterium]